MRNIDSIKLKISYDKLQQTFWFCFAWEVFDFTKQSCLINLTNNLLEDLTKNYFLLDVFFPTLFFVFHFALKLTGFCLVWLFC